MTKSSDPFDELAAMFLTEREVADGLPEACGRLPATVELLAVGHLPVRGGLWLTPYADAVARDVGPTVLLRLDGDETSLQLLRGDAEALTPLLKEEPQPTLTEAVQRLAPAVNTWVLRPPAGCAPMDMVLAAPDRITILSSADEAAVVAAYQLVKNLADAARTLQRALPDIALAVLGADSSSASSVLDRLRRTTLDCLDVDVSLVMCLTRMDAGIRSSGYMRFAGRPAPALGAVVRWIEQGTESAEQPAEEAQASVVPAMGREEESPAEEEPLVISPRRRRRIRPLRFAPKTPGHAPRPVVTKPASSPPTEQQPATEAFDGSDDRDRGLVEELLAGYARTPTPEPVQQTGTSASVPIPNTRPAGRIRLTPKPAADCEPKPPATAAEPDREGRPIALAEHVPGLAALPVRCPGQERVELAIDGRGVMHLLGREDAMREMRIVQAWAKAHRELIAMACSDHKFEPAGNTICHVFTDTPLSVSDLHGADLRLHVLAPVDVDGKRGWYSAPLNKPRG